MGLPQHALGMLALGVLAVVTLPNAVGLFGEMYRVDGGAASAAAELTATPTPARVRDEVVPTTVRAGVEAVATVASSSVPDTSATISPSSTPGNARPTSTAAATSVPSTATAKPLAAITSTPTARAVITRPPAATSTPIVLAPSFTPTSTPVATVTPASCLAGGYELAFTTPELKLTTTGSGATKLVLENRGSRLASDVRIEVSAVQGRDRLHAVALDGRKWDLTSEKWLQLSIGEITPRTTLVFELSYEVAKSPAPTDALKPSRSSETVELLVEAIGEHCADSTPPEVPSMRVVIALDAVVPPIVLPTVSQAKLKIEGDTTVLLEMKP